MNIQTQNQQVGSLIRLKDVLLRVRVSKSKYYAMIQQGLAPAPKKMGRISFWRSEDIDALILNLGTGGAV